MNLRPLVSGVAIAALIILTNESSTTAQTAQTAQAPQPAAQDPGVSAVEQADCLALGAARTARHAQTGALRFIGTAPGNPIAHAQSPEAMASPEGAARAYLATCGALFGLRNESGLQLTHSEQIDGRRTAIRFQQTHNAVPILGAEMIVNMDAASNIVSVAGETLAQTDINTTPAIDAAAAIDTALGTVAKTHGVNRALLTATTPAPWIFDPALIGPGEGAATLVWRIEITSSVLLHIRELVLVDAQRGHVALHFNQVESTRNRLTYTANNTTVLPGTLVCNEANSNCTGGDTHAVAAHIHARDAYDYYYNNFSRVGINNFSLTTTSTVHYGVGYADSFWNGGQLVYGDAHGFPLADDIVAHEWTHGVTQYTSQLISYYQSGAISESMADVFGELVDQSNGRGNDGAGVRWQIGEDIGGLGAIRNMQNPAAFNQPDKMTSALYTRTVNDNGGVHTNGGVNNKAAYLMVDGGTFNGQTISPLGVTKVAQIYYEVQRFRLTSGADYADLSDALFQGCNDLIGTFEITDADCLEVQQATIAVEMTLQPTGGPFNLDAALCPAGRKPSNLFFDNLEIGSGNFVTGAETGTVRWRYDSPYDQQYTHSGTHMLYANDFPADVSDSWIAMSSSVTVPPNAFLHFSHAFGFENGSYDGGVVEFTVNGTTWWDASSLFEVNGYNGTVQAVYGNPLASRLAFVNDSHGYISSRLNLSVQAGQNIRFRWRMGTDNVFYKVGWWLDDVRMYTCKAAAADGTDLDADGQADLTVYRPSTGTWFTATSSTGFGAGTVRQFGLSTDVPVSGDYDGDGRMDRAVYRPSTGTWHILPSTTGIEVNHALGLFEDVPVPGDYDGDGRIDPSVYRPSNGTWYILPSSRGYASISTITWGAPGYVPVPADYDGDSKTDLGVYRPATGRWYVLTSAGSSTATREFNWGANGDVPVPADYDGDGIADVAVYNPVTGEWSILHSAENFTTWSTYQWGLSSDVPVPSDYDGDAKTDLVVFRPSNGTWYIARSTTNYTTSVQYQFGLAGDVPSPNPPLAYAFAVRATFANLARRSDFDADRKADLTVYRPSNGTWYTKRSSTNFATSAMYQWGLSGDVPVSHDYDGDGRTDAAVYRPSAGTWFILRSESGYTTSTTIPWGLSGDIPVPGDYDGDERMEAAVFRPSTGQWHLLFAHLNYTTSSTYQWGLSGDVPVAGDYDGDTLTDIAVYRPSSGQWFIRHSRTDFTTSATYQWGIPGDISVPGEYDGDGKTDLAVYRPSTGQWFIKQSSTGYTTSMTIQWGLVNDVPVPSDFDGDRRTDVAVWRPAIGTWYVLKSSTNFTAHDAVQWGLPSDIPILRRP